MTQNAISHLLREGCHARVAALAAAAVAPASALALVGTV